MRMLYLRQTTNELTGEHSAILVRALPRRTGYDDAWLPAFVSDSRRRILNLLAGSFKTMQVKLAMSILEDMDYNSTSVGDEEAKKEMERRSGMSNEDSDNHRITVQELHTLLTPHDLKRLELYGRNLCDHHLVTDLLTTVAKLYFTQRLGVDFALSSLQAALLCGTGLQHKTIDVINAELKLPSNQTLAMFNKAVRKISVALHSVVEEHEREQFLSGEKRLEAENKALRLKDVSRQTFEEDIQEGAKTAMKKLRGEDMSTPTPTPTKLPREITQQSDIMKFAISGSDEQWTAAVEQQQRNNTSDNKDDTPGQVQIKMVQEKSTKIKRPLDVEDMEREDAKSKPGSSKKKKKKQKKSKQ